MIVVKIHEVNVIKNSFQIANEEEEATFCLEHGMEYARDNPQKVKITFKSIEKKNILKPAAKGKKSNKLRSPKQSKLF